MTTLASASALGAQAVSFAYGTEQVIREVTFSLAPGDSVALCGPNGSGKTTLLRLLSGELRPHRGEVLLHDRSLATMSTAIKARYIAVVPQRIDPRLAFPVRTLVALGRSPYTGAFGILDDDDHRAIDQAMLETECVALADRRFAELSGGEQQRVALAMALAQSTPILLLDEPTVHLDLHHQFEVLELLRELRRTRGLAVLAVLHDLNLAALYFDRMAVLEGGRIVADGASGEVVASPDTLAVFQVPLAIVRHPDAGKPQILLRPRD